MNHSQLTMVKGNRVEIKDIILEIETRFPVNTWTYKEIDFWPIIRNELYFKLLYHFETYHKPSEKQVSDISFSNKFINPISWWFALLGLKPKRNLFFSPGNVRVQFQNKHFNRFFDSYIEANGKAKESYMFDYLGHAKTNLEVAHKKIHVDVMSLINSYRKWQNLKSKFIKKETRINLNWKEYDDFINHINTLTKNSSLSLSIRQDRLMKYCQSLMINKKFFLKILKKTNPETVSVICYYTPWMYALLLAVDEMGIPAIEFQHGPMSDVHMAYANWSCIPENGYNTMPDQFYCWDSSSVDRMNQWAINSNKHHAILFGNPWIDYVMKFKSDQSIPKDTVLYTLQPFNYDKLFPERIIALIKETKFKWFIRLHPRQLSQKEKIKSFLEEKEIEHLVSIEQATNLPLPLLLKNCLLHITHFSGSTLEASMLGKVTVLINETGQTSFEQIIEEGKAFYLPINGSFKSEFLKVINDQKAAEV